MCGIAGILSNKYQTISRLSNRLSLMNRLQSHRGPDSDSIWIHPEGYIGYGHRRLSIIDLVTGNQPMRDDSGNCICYNGEIYNFLEIREQLASSYRFQTKSDTEVILAAYQKWGVDCLQHLRGMFSLAIWDEKKRQLFCARDRFGIKPFYYMNDGDCFYFASEAKSLLPFLSSIKTDLDGLKDYFVFQLCLGDKTMFSGIKQLLPGHYLLIKEGRIQKIKYWDINYVIDWDHTDSYFLSKMKELLEISVQLHMRSDVPVGAYVSGGVDSSLVAILGRSAQPSGEFKIFNGRFTVSRDYDESAYASEVAQSHGMTLYQIDIGSRDFIENIRNVIYHLDYPVAGPGSFPQYMVSKVAGDNLKVVLGGQGGDEVFGGYTRYLLAYFEQCIVGAIDGTLHNGNYIVTYESIIPNLRTLQAYKPLMKEFWRDGLFESMDRRYFRLINRANDLREEINWELMENYSAFDLFRAIFITKNVEKESYFDSMTHFDFKTLLPALLQVEDRMSMAHSLESRVPILDHPLIEFAATVPSNVKFKDGRLKNLLKEAFKEVLPESIINRNDKMGFPVPLTEWMKGDLHGFIFDIFNSERAQHREYLNPHFNIVSLLDREEKFSRKLWGLLSLELWQQEFHDKAHIYKDLLKE
ncbi:MAG: asparagine synthase (glutamine-hydrolyzing) [Dehalococcoidia bacterium]|nr:asparagine synthase (glutamine-hydrolyzing) [Dehalococcoidia bacterium]